MLGAEFEFSSFSQVPPYQVGVFLRMVSFPPSLSASCQNIAYSLALLFNQVNMLGLIVKHWLASAHKWFYISL